MHGPAHDSGAGFPIFGFGKEEVRTVHDLGVYGIFLDNCFPMVFLGVLAGVQLHCYERIYWKFESFRIDEHPGRSFAWIAAHP